MVDIFNLEMSVKPVKNGKEALVYRVLLHLIALRVYRDMLLFQGPAISATLNVALVVDHNPFVPLVMAGIYLMHLTDDVKPVNNGKDLNVIHAHLLLHVMIVKLVML